MWLRFIVLFWCIISLADAASSTQIDKDLTQIKNKINQVNQEINTKQQQQEHLNQAIKYSQDALIQYNSLMHELKLKRQLDIYEKHKIEASLAELISATTQAEQSAQVAVNQVYQQIVRIDNTPDSILSGNDEMEQQRKKIYLITILQEKQHQLANLQQQLNGLNQQNKKIQQEIDRINARLGSVRRQNQELQTKKQTDLLQAKQINTQIMLASNKLKTLQHREKRLNNLLAQIISSEAAEQKLQVSRRLATKNQSKLPMVNQQVEEASNVNKPQLLNQERSRPTNEPLIEKFGQVRNGSKSNGLLFKTQSGDKIFAIANGKVMYASTLPGFGNVVIIDHGNNYMSIYSGVIPEVRRGQKIAVGQNIANIGDSSSQPMGGMYFELRHLGKPVNPAVLLN